MSARIALDAMGGDFLALPNLQGAYRAARSSLERGTDLKIFLVGPRDQVLGSLDKAASDPNIPHEYRINKSEFQRLLEKEILIPVDCSQVVEMSESPSVAVRTKRDSSLAKAYQLVKEGKADAMISAGNSGAVMAFGIAILGRLPAVRRPAILCHFPSKKGATCVLDAGANADCTAEHLVQFAQMGHIYAQSVFGIVHPRVALMNIGEEEGKGNELVKATHPLLKEKLSEDYCGFVEGRDLFKGVVDVIVCDGFVGNVILKTAEGVAQVVKEGLREEFSKSLIYMLGAWLAKGAFLGMKAKLDYREYGAAPLVGLDGLGLVSHGSSDGKAMMNAILMAEKQVQQGLMTKLRAAFSSREAQNGTVEVAAGESK